MTDDDLTHEVPPVALPATYYLCVYFGITMALACAHTSIAYLAVAWSRRCRLVNPQHKMLYVTAEVVKAAVLMGSMCFPAWYSIVYRTLVRDEWDNPEVVHSIKLFVLWYTASDLSQFITVKIAQASTKQHHAATAAFGVFICFATEFAPVTRALLWYGLCSTIAFLTNAYKALRVLYGPRLFMERTRRVAYLMYKFELAVNWPIHSGYVALAIMDAVRTGSAARIVAVCVYLIVTAVFVKDDLELLWFLNTPGVVPPTEVKLAERGYDTHPVYVMPHGVGVLLGLIAKLF